MNKKIIKLGSANFLVIDLTKPLSLDQEVYPGDPKPKRVVFSDINKSGWHHYIHELGDHLFQPHGDAPNHQNPDSLDLGFEIYNLDYCFNPAFMIDLSDSIEATIINDIRLHIKIDLEHLKPFEELLAKKGAVILRTGYDKWLEKNLEHKPELLPYLTPEAASFLASFKNLKVVGTDSLTVDPHGSHAAHQLLKNKFIVESMVHLYNIPDDKRGDFDLQTSPLRITGATGGPVIACAFIEV